MSLKRLQLGKTGEEISSKYLSSIGYKILARNYRTKSGEVDIIAAQHKILVFIEVKTRKSNFLESPFSAVTKKKQIQISKVAQEYLSCNNLFNKDARFDVISIIMDQKNKPQIEHLENAFDLSYGF